MVSASCKFFLRVYVLHKGFKNTSQPSCQNQCGLILLLPVHFGGHLVAPNRENPSTSLKKLNPEPFSDVPEDFQQPASPKAQTKERDGRNWETIEQDFPRMTQRRRERNLWLTSSQISAEHFDKCPDKPSLMIYQSKLQEEKRALLPAL